jgi:uncharacterized membrane protein
MDQLKRFWSNLRGSFWFLPSLVVAGSVALAAALIDAHSAGSAQWLARWPRLFGASAAGARGMLSTIAGSMMTVVGVTFSMTLVALALASSQYTSRILRNFMRDRVTQVVLGIFSGIFAYCLIVLRTIRGGDEGGFVPGLAVSFAVVLAMGGVGVLIFFIHHIAASILVAESFDQIRGSAAGNLGIMLRILGGLQTIASLTANSSRRQALRDQAQWVAELAERTIESPHDRTRFESRLARVRESLETKPVQF